MTQSVLRIAWVMMVVDGWVVDGGIQESEIVYVYTHSTSSLITSVHEVIQVGGRVTHLETCYQRLHDVICIGNDVGCAKTYTFTLIAGFSLVSDQSWSMLRYYSRYGQMMLRRYPTVVNLTIDDMDWYSLQLQAVVYPEFLYCAILSTSDGLFGLAQNTRKTLYIV